MTLTLDQWHNRYTQQAIWTKSIRDYAYTLVNIQNKKMVLDIGCGTGVLVKEFSNKYPGSIIGLDIDFISLQYAKAYLKSSSKLTCGDAIHIPFRSMSIDLCLCHFLLLWLNNPVGSLKEMVRVTKPGGYILALAEPDYGGRIDYPKELEKIGNWQVESLKKQGANPLTGRKLRALFSQAGLFDITVGVLGGQWLDNVKDNEFALEWDVIYSDLEDNLEFTQEHNKLKEIDYSSRQDNSRILFVPTFYAIGKVAE